MDERPIARRRRRPPAEGSDAPAVGGIGASEAATAADAPDSSPSAAAEDLERLEIEIERENIRSENEAYVVHLWRPLLLLSLCLLASLAQVGFYANKIPDTRKHACKLLTRSSCCPLLTLSLPPLLRPRSPSVLPKRGRRDAHVPDWLRRDPHGGSAWRVS